MDAGEIVVKVNHPCGTNFCRPEAKFVQLFPNVLLGGSTGMVE